nr:hypothetical protein [Thiocapsa sp. KS1]
MKPIPSKKSRRAEPLSTVNPRAAGIDVGAQFHVVAVLPECDAEAVRTSARQGERSEAERPPVGVGACVPPQWRSGRSREAAKAVCKAHRTRRQAIYGPPRDARGTHRVAEGVVAAIYPTSL